MAVTAAELQVVYAGLLQREINKANIFVPFCNRRWEAQVQGNRTVKIPKSETAIALQTYTHGNDWSSTRDDVDIDYTDFTPNRARQNTVDIPYNVARELPVDLVVDAAQKQGRAYANDQDTVAYAAMYAGLVAANVANLGTSANFIPTTGVASVAAARPFVWTALWQLWLRAQATNIATPAGEGGTSNLWCVMPPYLFYALEEYLRASGNSDAVASNVIASGGPSRFLGLFDIYISNQDMTESRSSKDHGIILAGTTDATTWAEKPSVVQPLAPGVNQTGPFWRLNVMRETGVLVENSDFLLARAIRQET